MRNWPDYDDFEDDGPWDEDDTEKRRIINEIYHQQSL